MQKTPVLLFCVLVVIIQAGVIQASQVTFPSNIAPELSVALGVEESLVRTEMTRLMKESGWVIKWLLLSLPWFIVMLLIALLKTSRTHE